tara:strand:- start:655 stop:963 length:309 start_codon:yes stop_codon:yes gene_type:complete
MVEKKKNKTPKKIPSYLAKVGCWNCDLVYRIKVMKGKNVAEFLMKGKQKCKRCECDSLKVYSEYTTEKKILKDLILHHRLEMMHEHEKEENKNNGKEHGYIR